SPAPQRPLPVAGPAAPRSATARRLRRRLAPAAAGPRPLAPGPTSRVRPRRPARYSRSMASPGPARRSPAVPLRAVPLVLRRAGVTLLFVIAIFLGALSGIFLAYEKDLPQVSSLEDFEPNIITQVYTGDGKLLGEFAIERRVVVGFKDIPPVLRNATI